MSEILLMGRSISEFIKSASHDSVPPESVWIGVNLELCDPKCFTNW